MFIIRNLCSIIQYLYGILTIIIKLYKSEKFWVPKNWFLKKFGSKKNLGKKNFGPKKLKPPKNWVKIGSGTTELFMIWKKVVRTNIACTNVTVTFGIC